MYMYMYMYIYPCWQVAVMRSLPAAITALEHHGEELEVVKHGLLLFESLAVNDDNCVALMRVVPLAEAALEHFEDGELEELVPLVVGVIKNLSTVDANQVLAGGPVCPPVALFPPRLALSMYAHRR